jgi:hypothetical protein
MAAVLHAVSASEIELVSRSFKWRMGAMIATARLPRIKLVVSLALKTASGPIGWNGVIVL